MNMFVKVFRVFLGVLDQNILKIKFFWQKKKAWLEFLMTFQLLETRPAYDASSTIAGDVSSTPWKRKEKKNLA